MMKYYFYDYEDNNGRHEVHTEACDKLPSVENRTYIGQFSNCHAALDKASKDYPSKKFDGCFWCSRECHKG